MKTYCGNGLWASVELVRDSQGKAFLKIGKPDYDPAASAWKREQEMAQRRFERRGKDTGLAFPDGFLECK